MSLLSVGRRDANSPSDLLATAAFQDLIEKLRERFDRIVLDTPPAGAIADALVLAPLADGVLVVARSGKVDRTALGHTLERLSNARAASRGRPQPRPDRSLPLRLRAVLGGRHLRQRSKRLEVFLVVSRSHHEGSMSTVMRAAFLHRSHPGDPRLRGAARGSDTSQRAPHGDVLPDAVAPINAGQTGVRFNAIGLTGLRRPDRFPTSGTSATARASRPRPNRRSRHVFTDTGARCLNITYGVSLTVVDDRGGRAVASQGVTVTELPAPNSPECQR